MTLLAFLNSGFGLLVISTVFSVFGLFIKLIYNTLSKHSEKITDLEYKSKEIDSVKTSISGIGVRVGGVESGVRVVESQQSAILEHLNDLKTDRKESNAVLADILSSINSLRVDVEVIKSRNER